MTNTNSTQIDPQVKINVEDRCSFSVLNWLRNDLKSCDILACPAPPGLVVPCHDLQNCPLLVACRCKKNCHNTGTVLNPEPLYLIQNADAFPLLPYDVSRRCYFEPVHALLRLWLINSEFGIYSIRWMAGWLAGRS